MCVYICVCVCVHNRTYICIFAPPQILDRPSILPKVGSTFDQDYELLKVIYLIQIASFSCWLHIQHSYFAAF